VLMAGSIYKPRPSWRQFGLRTFFALVGLASVSCWLGAQAKWIRDRHAVISTHSTLYKYNAENAFADFPSPTLAPWSLRLFGERGVDGVEVIFNPDDPPDTTQPEQSRIKRLFPEAKIIMASLEEILRKREGEKARTREERERERALNQRFLEHLQMSHEMRRMNLHLLDPSLGVDAEALSAD